MEVELELDEEVVVLELVYPSVHWGTAAAEPARARATMVNFIVRIRATC